MINEFISSFTEDLSKPSFFEVRFMPTKVSKELNAIMDPRVLAMRCEAATLPGRTLSTTDLRIYGPTEKFPYQTSYEDITLSFIVTDTMVEKLFFNGWMDIINPSNTWNFKYKKDYVMDIEIAQYDVTGDISHTIRLIDAYPISVNQLDLAWSAMDTYHKLAVTFAYTYWTKPLSENASNADAAATGVATDNQAVSNIPSMLQSNPGTIPQGTLLDVTNQSIGPFDTMKDQYASGVNAKNQTGGIVG